MDSNIFSEHNPWWCRPELILEDIYITELERQEYPFYHPLLPGLTLDKDGVLTLRGPRRIGKTTLLKLLIKRLLLDERVDREQLLRLPSGWHLNNSGRGVSCRQVSFSLCHRIQNCLKHIGAGTSNNSAM